MYDFDLIFNKYLDNRVLNEDRCFSPANDSFNPKAAIIISAFIAVRCCSVSAKLSGLGWRSISSADHARFLITKLRFG